MKRTTFVLLVALVAIGCDPAMTLRQRGGTTIPKEASQPPLSISVNESRQLVGERWYVSTVYISNSTDASVEITKVELVTSARGYQLKDWAEQRLKRDLGARESARLELWFDLDGAVAEVFREPAELRVHYESAGVETVATVLIEGTPWSPR
jgi:hypothetical protein